MALNFDKLVKFVKSNPEASQKAAADAQGIVIGQLPMTQFCIAKVQAGVVTKAPATAPSVKKLRDAGDRWELIAARTGLGVSAVKTLYAETGGDIHGYSGKGRNFGATPSGKAQAKPKGKAATGGKPGRPPGRTAAAKPKGKTQIVRNTTRRSASNPS